MDKKQETLIRKTGVFTLAQAEELGLSQQSVSRLVASGHIMRVGHGVFLHPKARVGGDVSFRIAAARFGRESVIGGLSALFHYNLCEQIPLEVWVLVPPSKRTTAQGFRLIRTKADLDKWVVDEQGYRIASIERTLLEAMRYATKIGERTAVKASRDALASGLTTERRLAKAAKDLGLERTLARYLEYIAP